MSEQGTTKERSKLRRAAEILADSCCGVSVYGTMPVDHTQVRHIAREWLEQTKDIPPPPPPPPMRVVRDGVPGSIALLLVIAAAVIGWVLS